MSATNRGGTRSPLDHYRTPAWATEAILRYGGLDAGGQYAILDPGCGSGAIAEVVRRFAPRAHYVGIDCEDYGSASQYDHYVLADFLAADTPTKLIGTQLANVKPYGLSIGNPPYNIALPFVQRSLQLATTTAFLLRLNWLAGQSRAAFHKQHPADIFVLPKRPSFTADGKTDATEYAWFVWGPGRGNHWEILDLSFMGTNCQ